MNQGIRNPTRKVLYTVQCGIWWSNKWVKLNYFSLHEAKSIEKRIQNLIDEADLDGDGKINFLEFHEIMRKKNSANKRKMDQTPPKPPDGGWGWVIVFACFLCNFVVGNQKCNEGLVIL